MELKDITNIDERLVWLTTPGVFRQIIVLPTSEAASRMQKQIGNAKHTGILCIHAMKEMAGFRTQMILISEETCRYARRCHREFDRWFLRDMENRLTTDGKVLILP